MLAINLSLFHPVTLLRQPRCDKNRLNHSLRVGPTRPGDVKSGSVAGTGSHDGQTERDIDGSVGCDEFERDVPLIVIHGDDGVKLTGKGAAEKRIGRQRSRDGQSRLHRCRNGG